MSDTDPIEDITPDPVDPDPAPVVPDPEPVDEPRPAFVDEILERIDAVMAHAQPAPENDPTPESDLPGDGDVIEPDESPVKKPWTHRGFFGR